MARHGAMGRFGFDSLAIWSHQNRGHKAQRAEALRNRIRLYVAVVIFACPDELAAPLERGSDHVIDQAMLIFRTSCIEFRLEFALENLLRSEEHTSAIQSLMRNSYDVFCLKKKKNQQQQSYTTIAIS